MYDCTRALGQRILLFTSRPEDWQPLLAQPERQWRCGYSARTLAHSWEAANGFPVEVELAFSQTNAPQLLQLTPLRYQNLRFHCLQREAGHPRMIFLF
jgi:hypothetical protein